MKKFKVSCNKFLRMGVVKLLDESVLNDYEQKGIA